MEILFGILNENLQVKCIERNIDAWKINWKIHSPPECVCWCCRILLLLLCVTGDVLLRGIESCGHFPFDVDFSNSLDLAHCSIISAQLCLPQNLAHWSGRKPRPGSISTGDAPIIIYIKVVYYNEMQARTETGILKVSK